MAAGQDLGLGCFSFSWYSWLAWALPLEPWPLPTSQGSRCAPGCYPLAPFLPLPLYLSFLIHLLRAGFPFLRLCGPILSLTDEKTDAERGGGIHPGSHSELEMARLSRSKRCNQPSRTLKKSAWWGDTRGK